MTENNNDSQPLSKDFEFNNGIGDALKEKEQYAFSWPKTITVLVFGSGIIIGVTFGLLEIGKRLFKVNTMQQVVQDDAQAFDLEQLVDEVNNDEWDVLPMTSDLENDPSSKVKRADLEDIQDRSIDSVTDTFKEPVSDPYPKKTTSIQAKPNNIGLKKDVTTPDESHPVNAKKPAVFRVIAGSFKDFSNAKNQLATLKQKKIDGYIFTDVIDGVMVHRIQVGAFSSQENAESLMKRLAKHNVDSYISH